MNDSEERIRTALAAYLVAKGVAEERPGYGHATGEQVADTVVTFLAEWNAGREAGAG